VASDRDKDDPKPEKISAEAAGHGRGLKAAVF